MRFYAFQYDAGRTTTWGKPNEHTGHLSIAGDLAMFATKKSRDAWVAVDDTRREAVTAKQARGFCLGLTIEEYREHLQSLKRNLEISTEEET